MQLRDSANKRKALGQVLRYDYQRQTGTLQAQQAQRQAIATADLHRQRTLLWTLLAGAGMLGLLAGQQ